MALPRNSALTAGSSASALRIFLLCALTASVVACSIFTRGWGIGQDSRLMHYIVFLMQHGFAPYRDIIDMNMPVSYMVEWAGMRIFGPGDLAWRCFDLFILGLGCGAAVYLARPRGRFAAIFAALLVAVCHFSGGAFDLGQRDYTLAIFLLIGTASLFLAVRRRTAWPMAFFAVLFGFAAGIKPIVVPLPFALLFVVLALPRSRRASRASLVAWSCLGAIIPAVSVCALLQHYHVWHAFFGPIAGLALYHRGNGNLAFHALLLRWLPWFMEPLFALSVLAGILAWRAKKWSWEDSVLLAIGLSGIAGYLYQGKGWSYQAATALMFLAVLAARAFAGVLENCSSPSGVGGVLFPVAFALAALLPAAYIPLAMARHMHQWLPMDPVEASIMESLQAVSSQSGNNRGNLSGHVQCLDWNAGCIGALYRLRLLPSTGFIYDFYLFPAQPAPITHELQARFLAKVQAAPPTVFVLTAHDWPTMQGLAKLNRWPEFANWLNANYGIAQEVLIINGRPTDRGYRIYLRR